jgi:hypothetical protein
MKKIIIYTAITLIIAGLGIWYCIEALPWYVLLVGGVLLSQMIFQSAFFILATIVRCKIEQGYKND